MHNTMAYSFAFSSDDESKSSRIPSLTKLPNARMVEQLQNTTLLHQTRQQPESYHTDFEPLPKTIESALRPSHRAIVVTETNKPFRVVNVNGAWESLCGYSYVESKGKSLGSLIRGPETDQLAITALMSQLLKGEEAGTILTKYVALVQFLDVVHFVGYLFCFRSYCLFSTIFVCFLVVTTAHTMFPCSYTKSGRKFQNRLRVGPIFDEENGQLAYFVGVLQEMKM